MTVIVYKNDWLASDSLVSTSGSIRTGYVPKIARGKAVMGGGAGQPGDLERYLDWIRGDCKGDLPEFSKYFSGLLIDEGDLYYVEQDTGLYLAGSKQGAVGSGYEVAMGAMEAGASAHNAVRAAIALDTNCGGEIQVLTLGEPLLTT